MIKVLTDNNPDGNLLGISANEKISFYGMPPMVQRSNSMQGPILPVALGEIVTYSFALTPAASCLANTTTEIPFTVPGVVTTDFILGVNKSSLQAGLGLLGARCATASVVSTTWCNNTAGTLTPTAQEVAGVSVIRGIPWSSVTLSPVTVAANTQAEQIFTVTPTAAVATAIVLNGSVIGATIVSGGSGYTQAPTVIFSGGTVSLSPEPVTSGTGTTFGVPLPGPSTPAVPGGVGATGIAIINTTGSVVSIQIVNPGSGYTSTPTIKFVGGNNIVPGQMLFVTKPSFQAGIGITNCRVTGQNQIGITFTNFTAAAVAPTSEAYAVLACSAMPVISPLVRFGVATSTPGINVAVTTITESAYTVTGLLSSDIALNANWSTTPFAAAGVWGIVTRAGTGSVSVGYINFGAATSTIGAIVFDLTVMRKAAQTPLTVQPQLVTYTSVAANSSAEISAGTITIPVSTQVFINNLTPQLPNIFICPMARVSAANTVQLHVFNMSYAAIVPTAGIVLIANAAQEKQPLASLTTPATTPGYTSQPIGFTLNQCAGAIQENIMTLQQEGLFGGGF